MQLSNMPLRQTKEMVALAIEEKKKRIAENGIKYYKPTDYQIPFHKSTAKVRSIFGGNRSGKTFAAITEGVWYATGTHPYKIIPVPNYGRIVCMDFPTIEKVMIPMIKKFMPKNMIKSYSRDLRTFTLTNGSTIELMSNEQEIEKFESASRHWVMFDEEPDEAVYKANLTRILDTNGDIWFALTPLHGMSWIYNTIYEASVNSPRIEVFDFDTRKNPHLDITVIDEIGKELSEAERDMRFGGKFVSLSGLVYKEFNSLIHEIPSFPIAQEFPRFCAIDPHPRNPTVVVYMAVMPTPYFKNECFKNRIELPEINDDVVYIIYDEIYPETSMLISDTCEFMKVKEGNDFIRYRLIDWSANTPNPIIGKTIRQEFADNGFNTVLADKNVPNGIFKVREKLATNSLFFFNNCKKTLWEIKHYVWDDYRVGKVDKDSKEQPKKKHDHAMDDLRYLCASNPRFDTPRMYIPKRKTIDSYTGY